MPRTRSCLVLAVLAAALLGCDRSPTTVGPNVADAIATQAETLGSMLQPQGDPGPLAPGGSLYKLLDLALQKVAKEQGADAARKLAAPIQQLLADAERAAKAGDQATAAARLAAARAAGIKAIVDVLGRDGIATYLTGQARRADELRIKLEAAAKAGQNVDGARAILAQIDASLKDAASALAAGNVTRALDLASQAADLFPSLLRALTPPPPMKLAPMLNLDVLLQRAVEQYAREHGKEAATQLVATRNQLLEEAGKAARAKDTATARQKLEAARTETIRIIALVLGVGAANDLIADVSKRAVVLRARVDSAAKAGADMSAARAVLARIDQALADARAAATAGNAAAALDAAARAGDLIGSMGAALRPPKTPAPPPPAWSLPPLLGQALDSISRQKGGAAAKAILVQLDSLNRAAAAAAKAGDTATAHARLAAARALTLQTIVDALGRGAVEGVLKAVDAGLATLRAGLSAARTAGKDVTRVAEAADKAAALLTQARDALGKGQLVPALDLGAQAGDWIQEGTSRLARANK